MLAAPPDGRGWIRRDPAQREGFPDREHHRVQRGLRGQPDGGGLGGHVLRAGLPVAGGGGPVAGGAGSGEKSKITRYKSVPETPSTMQ